MISEEIKLDRKRSFGTVYNDPNIGFYQDNKPFRHDGTPYVPAETVAKTLGPPVPPVNDFPAASELTEAVNKLTQRLDVAAGTQQKKNWEDKRFKRASELQEEKGGGDGSSSATDAT